MQKKNTENPSAQKLNQNQGLSSELPLPSASGILGSAASTSALPQPPKVNQNILNKVIQTHLASSKFPDATDTFFSTLEKYGYSKDQIAKAKEYNKALLNKSNSDATEQMSLNSDGILTPTAAELKKQSDKENFENAPPVIKQVLQVGSKANERFDEAAKGVESGFKKSGNAFSDMQMSAFSNKPITEKLGDFGADAVHMIKGLLDATFSAANVIIPEFIVFNESLNAIKSTPDNIKLKLYNSIVPTPEYIEHDDKKASEKFDEVLEIPFTAPAFIAGKLGYKPEDESWQKDVLDISGFLVPIAAAKAGMGVSERIKSIEDLKNISNNLENATPEQLSDFKAVSKAIKDTSPSEVKAEMIKNKLQTYSQIPNAEIVKVLSENESPASLREKASSLNEKISAEQDPVIKEELATQQASLNAMADAVEMHEEVAANPKDYIDTISKDDTISPEQKQVYIDQITESAQLDSGIKNVEKAKIDHISNIEAMKNPGSSEFYDKAMQALDDPTIVDRVKSSLDEAVKSGEMTIEEANANFEHFQKVVGIDKTIPDKIKTPESRIEANKLIEKKNDIKESVRGKDPVLAEKEIESSKSRVEKIDEKLKEIVSKEAEIKEVENETPEMRRHAVWKNVLKENVKDEGLRKGLEQKGLDYIVSKEPINKAQATEIVDSAIKSDNLAELENKVLNDSNEMNRTTRGTVSAILGKHYFDLAEASTDAVTKQKNYDKFYDYTKKAAQLATEGGQAGNAIGKIIKEIYVNNPETVIRELSTKMEKANEQQLSTHTEDIKNTYDSIKKILESEEGQKAITEEIAKRSERLFGKETQKKIIDIFDKAKIDTKGKLFDASIGLPIEVYNGAVEVMKQAALLGAKGAKIIEDGIIHIRNNYKEEWNDETFKKEWDKKLKDSGIEFDKSPGNPKKVLAKKQEASILDAIEKKANRLNEKNRSSFLKDIIQEVENEGGLSEQRFKDLYAKALGLETMTPELSQKIRDLSGKVKEAQTAESKLSSVYDKAIEEQSAGKISEETKSELNKAKEELRKSSREADKAQAELSSILRDKKDFADTFISLMQTNVLTPISLARNIVGVAPDFFIIRPASNLAAGGIDFLRKLAANLDKLSKFMGAEKEINPLARTKGAWLATPEAIRNAYTAFLTGEVPNKFGERNQFKKLEPIEAGKRIYNALQGKNKMKASEWASSILEATAGIPGSAIGRGLIGPDVFIRTLAEKSKLYESGVTKGLKGAELEKFVEFPDEVATKEAQAYADDVTFQGDNRVSKAISSLSREFKGKEGDSGFKNFAKSTGRILGSTLALYTKTPTNVFAASVKLLYPEISLAQGIMEWQKGNKVKSERLFGQYAAGMGVRYVISNMANAGIITPTTDYKDKSYALEEDGGAKKGGQVNYSRMMRYLTFQDSGEKPSDIWVDYKWLGPIGLVMGTQSSVAKQEGDAEWKYPTSGSAFNALKYTSELPYIQSMGAITNAIQDPEKFSKNFIVGTGSTLASAVIPRTVTQVSQAGLDEKKNISDKDIYEYAKKKWQMEHFDGDKLPSKISLWGESIDNAPKGTNPYAWYVFNFYKDRNPNENSLSYKIQDLVDKTGNKDAIPSRPQNSITIGKQKVLLNDKEYEDFQRYVGKRRADLAKVYIDHGSYKDDDDDKRISTLQDIYRDSHTDGKNMLINSTVRLTKMQNGVKPTGKRHSGRGVKRGR